jgi:microcystin-dependent protein
VGTPYLGEVRHFSFGFAPRGWAQCNGQTLPINQYQALFALLGTTYGGNGINTFALPNLQGRTAAHFGAGLVQGQALGEEAHTLALGELPSHTHLVQGTAVAGTTSQPGGNILAAGTDSASDSRYATTAPTLALAPATITSGGGGQSHENRQPYLTVNLCIALQGIFPSRN